MKTTDEWILKSVTYSHWNTLYPGRELNPLIMVTWIELLSDKKDKNYMFSIICRILKAYLALLAYIIFYVPDIKAIYF